jgi:NAD(P)-dependent dehydrogenase (short-subunit alcohol dehydrogenase family)
VNTASLAGLTPAPGMAPYSMTKHAVVGLTLSLRAEAASHGVRASVVCPGVIDTPLLDKKNPADLPQTADFGNARELLEKAIGKAYPPELLARDVLAGMVRNRAVIVSPHHARRAWLIYRTAPNLVLGLVDRTFRRWSADRRPLGAPAPSEGTTQASHPVAARAGGTEATGQ